MRPSYLFCMLVLMIGLNPSSNEVSAQVVRIGKVVQPNLSLGTLTVSASPAVVTVALVAGGTAVATLPIAITTSWTNINIGSTTSLYASFSSSTSALAGGTPTASIPSSSVLGKVPTGTPTSYTPFTQTTPVGAASAGLQLYSSLGMLLASGSRTDNLSLEINLTSLPQLPAANYSGTLLIQAQDF